MTSSQKYYSELRASIFGDANWKALTQNAIGKPKISFQLNREFNDTSSFIAYDFLVELYQLFGKPIVPINLESGCVNIATRMDEFRNKLGYDFRYLMLVQPDFHSVFRRFGVQGIFLHAFPPSEEKRHTNIDWHIFKVDNSGVPQPK